MTQMKRKLPASQAEQIHACDQRHICRVIVRKKLVEVEQACKQPGKKNKLERPEQIFHLAILLFEFAGKTTDEFESRRNTWSAGFAGNTLTFNCRKLRNFKALLKSANRHLIFDRIISRI